MKNKFNYEYWSFIIDGLYSYNGNSVRNEVLTGNPIHGRFNTSKLQDYSRALQCRLRAVDLNEHVAKDLLKEIKLICIVMLIQLIY